MRGREDSERRAIWKLDAINGWRGGKKRWRGGVERRKEG